MGAGEPRQGLTHPTRMVTFANTFLACIPLRLGWDGGTLIPGCNPAGMSLCYEIVQLNRYGTYSSQILKMCTNTVIARDIQHPTKGTCNNSPLIWIPKGSRIRT